MTSPVSRLLLEASTAATNHRSPAHRSAAAREVSGLSVGDLVSDDNGASHLNIAIREAVLTMALSRDQAVIAEVATATQAMVRAARMQVRSRDVTAAPRRWWIDGGAA